MKELDSFLSEKKNAAKKPRPKKRKEGKDDKKYFELMGKYKKARRGDRHAAHEILEQAKELAKEGNVSPQCKLGACYL